MSADKLLLSTDLDRTLLPNGPQAESAGVRERFRRITDLPWVSLAYVSGRHLALVQRAILNYNLPRPDYAITDVGARIYQQQDGDWQPWAQWEQEISTEWPGREPLAELLKTEPCLRLQEANKQGPHKLSYYLPIQTNTQTLQTRLQALLGQAGFRVNFIWSLDEPAGLGLLDVLPANATKLHALEYLRHSLGLAPEQVLFAGDSGNDLPVLSSELSAVLVANASTEVKQQALEQARLAGNQTRLYLAQGTLPGLNGNYAAGILEGLYHFHPQARAWLEDEPT